MTNLEALKAQYIAKGGAPEDVAEMTHNAQVLAAMAGFDSIKDIAAQSPKGTKSYWGTLVSAMQSNIVVADNAISGTLKFIAGGIAPGTLSGDGNFLALKFIDPNGADKIEVGLVPSAGSGFVALDEDMDAVFKIDDSVGGKRQVLKLKITKDGIEKIQSFDLSGLTLEES